MTNTIWNCCWISSQYFSVCVSVCVRVWVWQFNQSVSLCNPSKKVKYYFILFFFCLYVIHLTFCVIRHFGFYLFCSPNQIFCTRSCVVLIQIKFLTEKKKKKKRKCLAQLTPCRWRRSPRSSQWLSSPSLSRQTTGVA